MGYSHLRVVLRYIFLYGFPFYLNLNLASVRLVIRIIHNIYVFRQQPQ